MWGTFPAFQKLKIVTGPLGLTKQRNKALEHASFADIVIFFDDDFIPHPNWIKAVTNIFENQADVGCITGHVLADGVKGAGLSFEAAVAIINKQDGYPTAVDAEAVSPYGCNMAFRRSAIHGLRFG